jgi:ribonuclease Z
VDKVFISHLHSDHIADLGALYSLGALYRYPISGAPAANVPLRIWGPATFKPSTNPTPPLPDPPLDYPPVGIKPMLENFHKAYETDFYVRQLFTDPKDFSITDAAVETVGSTTDLPDAPSTVVYSNNGVTVTAFLVNHDPVTPAYGFRVDYQGHSFVYSGDTTYNDNLVNNSKNVDLLVHEVYGYQRDDAPEIYDYHTSPEDAARVFLQTNPKLAVFTHLAIPQGTTPRDLVRRTRKAGYHGKLKPGRDLMVIKINSNSKVIAKYLPESEGIDEKPATSDFVEVEQYRRRKTP